MTELSERGTIELLAIVHCDFFGYAEAAYYVLPEKFLQGCGCDIAKRLASILFEKYSIATAAYLKLPGAVGKGPTMSMPIARGARLEVLGGLLLVGTCCSGRASDN